MSSIERDDIIDIMKGILILSVVAGHAQIPVHRYIYLFHMAVFFMISGFLWNSVQIRRSLPIFIHKRLHDLYLPFIYSNVFFCVLDGIAPGVFDHGTKVKSLGNFGVHLIKILLFQGRMTLSDATWFLYALFTSSIVYFLLLTLSKRNKHTDIINIVLIVITFVISCVASNAGFNYYEFGTICSAIVCLWLGDTARQCAVKIQEQYFRGNTVYQGSMYLILGGSILTALLFIRSEEIQFVENIIINPMYFLIATIAGWLFVKGVALLIYCSETVLKRFLTILGVNSLPIMCLHMLGFKITAYLQCRIYHKSYSMISNYPIAFNVRGWWIIYTFFGITIPLTYIFLFRQISGKIKRKVIN